MLHHSQGRRAIGKLFRAGDKGVRISIFVAQTSSLPYRRLLVGRLPEVVESADWKSAIFTT
jgi:hypothetical protein